MNIDLTELLNETKNFIFVDKELVIDNEILKNTDIKEIDYLNIKGNINKVNENMYKLNLNIKGNIYLLCAICLEKIKYSININISDVIENTANNKNILDIFDVIWENILLEVPNKVSHDNCNIKTSGNGWTFLKDGNSKKNDQLSDLKNILDMEEE